jgi:hypothetical protein
MPPEHGPLETDLLGLTPRSHRHSRPATTDPAVMRVRALVLSEVGEVKSREVRHRLLTVLAAAVCAVPAGSRSIADHTQGQSLMRRRR